MPFRCHAIAAAAGPLLFPALGARADSANTNSIIRELPANSALCAVRGNMQLYIPVATLEQSLSGNSAGALF